MAIREFARLRKLAKFKSPLGRLLYDCFTSNVSNVSTGAAKVPWSMGGINLWQSAIPRRPYSLKVSRSDRLPAVLEAEMSCSTTFSGDVTPFLS
jgi:hypothetical protein